MLLLERNVVLAVWYMDYNDKTYQWKQKYD